MQTTSQNHQIAAYLMRGGSITPIDALKMFGCFRLSARIADLRRSGYRIKTKLVTEKGKTFASYRLEASDEVWGIWFQEGHQLRQGYERNSRRHLRSPLVYVHRLHRLGDVMQYFVEHLWEGFGNNLSYFSGPYNTYEEAECHCHILNHYSCNGARWTIRRSNNA